MPARLVALNDGPSLVLDKSIVLVGRHPDCDVQLDSVKVSRRHCCLAQVNDYWVVRDLGSMNGVWINGRRVEHGRLNAGDEVAIANYRYRFKVEEEKAAPSAGRAARAKRSSGNNGSGSAGHAVPLEGALLSTDEPVILEEDEGSEATRRAGADESSEKPPPSKIALAPVSDPQVQRARRRKRK